MTVAADAEIGQGWIVKHIIPQFPVEGVCLETEADRVFQIGVHLLDVGGRIVPQQLWPGQGGHVAVFQGAGGRGFAALPADEGRQGQKAGHHDDEEERLPMEAEG